MKTRLSTPSRGKKLLYLLGEMSDQELDALSLWLASPLHGGSPQFAAMLSLILESQKENPNSFSAHLFDDLLSPDRKMDAKKEAYIWVRLAKMQAAVIEYIAWKGFEGHGQEQKHQFLREVVRRGLEPVVESAYQAGITALPIALSAQRFRDELDLEILYCDHLANLKNPTTNKHLKEVHAAIDKHFLLQKLKYACAGVIELEPDANPEESILLASALAAVAANLPAMPKVIQAYYHAFRMLQLTILDAANPTHASESHFKAFDLLFSKPGEFIPEEAMDLFIHGQNYCILHHRKGKPGQLTRLESLYDRVLQSGVTTNEGLLAVAFYKNTVELFCRLGRLDWVANFLESYRHRVSSDPDGLSYKFGLAVMRFFEANYKEVVLQLADILTQLERLEMSTGARVYLCQALWELGELDELVNALEAFRHYLRRNNQLNPGLLKRYKRFQTLLLRLCAALSGRMKLRRPRLLRLQQEIAQSAEAGNYRWLHVKIQETIEGRGAMMRMIGN